MSTTPPEDLPLLSFEVDGIVYRRYDPVPGPDVIRPMVELVPDHECEGMNGRDYCAWDLDDYEWC